MSARVVEVAADETNFEAITAVAMAAAASDDKRMVQVRLAVAMAPEILVED